MTTQKTVVTNDEIKEMLEGLMDEGKPTRELLIKTAVEVYNIPRLKVEKILEELLHKYHTYSAILTEQKKRSQK